MYTVYRKELRSFFTNMLGPVFIAALLLMTGIIALAVNLRALSPQLEYSLGIISFTFLLLIPLLTMRSIAEEKRQRTDTLLYSLPLSSSQIVLGKYFAMLTVQLIPVAVMALYPIIFSIYGSVSFVSTYASLLGFFFFGAALTAIGVFVSALTDNQIIAGVISAAAMLLCFLLDTIAALIPAAAIYSFFAFTVMIVLLGVICYLMTRNSYISGGAALALEIAMLIVYKLNTPIFEGAAPAVLRWMSLYDRMYYFTVGIFDLRSFLFFLSFSFAFLFFAVTAVEKKRWS